MHTIHQEDILSLLRDFKCLRNSHIGKYMAAKHNSTDKHLSIMLKQLIFMGDIRIDNEFIMLPGRKINPDVIKAFDVATDLTDGDVDIFYPGAEPFTLMFSVNANAVVGTAYNNYGIVIAKRHLESSICASLRSSDQNSTVIFVLEDIEQQMLLKVTNKHYFAVQDENGKYKFYKAARKPPSKEE